MHDYPISDDELVLMRRFYAPRPYPAVIPTPGIFDEPLCCASFNQSWLSHVLGALAALDQPDAWLGTEAEIDAARDQITLLKHQLSVDCEGPMAKKALLEYRTDPLVHGGSAAAGYNTIPLSTVYDPDGLVTIVGGKWYFNESGSYSIRWAATAYRVGRTQSLIRRTIQGATVDILQGISSFSGVATTTTATLPGSGFLDVSIPVPTLELSVWAESASANFGLGVSLTDSDMENVYAFVELEKVN